jgi:hypothetical protein
MFATLPTAADMVSRNVCGRIARGGCAGKRRRRIRCARRHLADTFRASPRAAPLVAATGATIRSRRAPASRCFEVAGRNGQAAKMCDVSGEGVCTRARALITRALLIDGPALQPIHAEGTDLCADWQHSVDRFAYPTARRCQSVRVPGRDYPARTSGPNHHGDLNAETRTGVVSWCSRACGHRGRTPGDPSDPTSASTARSKSTYPH